MSCLHNNSHILTKFFSKTHKCQFEFPTSEEWFQFPCGVVSDTVDSKSHYQIYSCFRYPTAIPKYFHDQ
ncbi:glycoside hydrolase family 35 protein [Moniliophthora roreri]|nr:glycoside hydrolase family 35 protein [Moniliophthora roreri]